MLTPQVNCPIVLVFDMIQNTDMYIIYYVYIIHDFTQCVIIAGRNNKKKKVFSYKPNLSSLTVSTRRACRDVFKRHYFALGVRAIVDNLITILHDNTIKFSTRRKR